MFGSEILEVAIGVIFVFLLVSVICSAIREGIEARLKSRAAYLEHGIRELLHDPKGEGLARSFYEHPLIYSLFASGYKPGETAGRPRMLASGGNLPSYIPARNFARAIMDIAARGPATDALSSDPSSPVLSVDSIRANIFNLQSPQLQRVLLGALDTAEGELAAAQAELEQWYDTSMDRVSGWYKRSTHWIILWVALFVAVALNVNTLTIAAYLYRNDSARANLVALAEARVAAGTAAASSATPEPSYRAAVAELDTLGLPIGWSNGRRVGAPIQKGQSLASIVWSDWIIAIPGWLLTALAATMGAPFWFDVLNKAMVIRSTVKPHEKSPEESSEDRQLKGQRPPATGGKGAKGGKGGKGERGASEGAVELGEPESGSGHAPTRGSPRFVVDPEASPPDEESHLDGCSVVATEADATSDEDLPAAEGGVA